MKTSGWDSRGLVMVILALSVALSILLFSVMAVLDLYNPPDDNRLGHMAMTGAIAVISASISLIGVYIGMAVSRRLNGLNVQAEPGSEINIEVMDEEAPPDVRE